MTALTSAPLCAKSIATVSPVPFRFAAPATTAKFLREFDGVLWYVFVIIALSVVEV
jgi:hypothetical protein